MKALRMTDNILLNIPSLVCRVTGDMPWTIVSANAMCELMLGVTQEEIVSGKINFEDRIVKEDLPRIFDALKFVERDGMFQTYYRLLHTDGSCRWVIDSGKPVEENGVSYLDSVITDITLLVDHSAVHVQSTKLKSLGQLSAVVAHDINNVLGAARMCAEMTEMVKNNPAKVSEFSQKIIEAVDSAGKMISSLLTFGCKGSLSLSCQRLDELLILSGDLALNDLRKGAFAAVPIELKVLPEAGDMKVSVNSVAMQHAVSQLVQNSAEWMAPAGGEIEIRSEECDLEFTRGFKLIGKQLPPGKYGTISVTDHGCGIAEEDIKLLFDPFFSRREPKQKGVGLGLSVVYGILKSNHCGLELETSPKGTTVRIFIPLAETVNL